MADESRPLKLDRDTPLDPQERGGHTYIHNISGEFLFRLSSEEDESQIDLLRMAYNSGTTAGFKAAVASARALLAALEERS